VSFKEKMTVGIRMQEGNNSARPRLGRGGEWLGLINEGNLLVRQEREREREREQETCQPVAGAR
jgi:hypothetical protein